MNNDFQWNLQQVADGIPRGVLEERAKRSFLYPHDNIWPKDTSLFITTADTIYENLNSNQKKWFLSVCLASFLLNQKKSPQFKSWFQSKTSINEVLGLELAWDEIITWNWGRIAIPGADQAEGWNDRIIYALAGVSKSTTSMLHLPTWCDQCLSNDSHEAIQTAAELIASRNSNVGILFWPQLDPTSSNIVIRGASLGLPIFLSFYSLTANKPIPSILATGRVDNNGILHEVSGLEEKFRLAHKKGFSSFLYPLLPGVKPLDSTGKVNPIGVQDLEQSCTIWISQKTVESNGTVNVWLAAALDRIGDQLFEVKRVLSHSRFLITAGTIILIILLGVFFYSGKQSTITSRIATPDQPIKVPETTPTVSGQSRATSVPPERIIQQSMEETPKIQTNTVSQQDTGIPYYSPPAHQSPVVVKAPDDLDTAINNSHLSENDDSATTASCFRVAKEMMNSSKLISAKQKYEECFTQNATYLDTLLDYQKLLKGLEGFQSARSTFKHSMVNHTSRTVAFAELMFDEPKTRYTKIRKFVETDPSFLPAYYWLGMDCYEVYGADKVCAEYIQKFVEGSKVGKSSQFFVNNQRLRVMIEEARNVFPRK